MVHVISCDDGERWLDFENILKVEPTGLADELNVREKKDDNLGWLQSLGSSNWKDEIIIYWDREDGEEQNFLRKYREFDFE